MPDLRMHLPWPVWPRPKHGNAGRRWTRPGSRATPHHPASDASTRPEPGYEHQQAQALCDLLTASQGSVTRVRVVSARPRLLDAIEAEAARRGLAARQGSPSPAVGRKPWVILGHTSP